MNIIGKLVIGVIVLLMVLTLIPALIPDAEYSPGAKEWLEIAHAPATIPPRQNRFHAQVGFLAAPGTNMIEYGADLVSSANRVLEANGTEFDPGWRNPPLDLSPALADLDFDAVLENPLAWLADNRSLLRQLIDDNAVLLERYNRLAQMNGYAFTLTPDYRAPIPNYSGLAAIHRLNSLAIAATVVADAANLARLREAIDKQRLALADAATIIEKMVGVSLLRFDLRLYSRLLTLPGVVERHEPFPALDAEERTLRRAYIHEFASVSSLFDGDSLRSDDSSWFEEVTIDLYLKPRNLENQAHEHTWLRLLSLESRPLDERRSTGNDTAYSWWERYSDPVGYILYEISRPSFTYHDRIEHLDGLITLLNAAAEIQRRSLRGGAIDAYLEKVDAGAHPGYAGATLGYDAVTDELYVELPGYEPMPSAGPMERPPRLALD